MPGPLRKDGTGWGAPNSLSTPSPKLCLRSGSLSVTSLSLFPYSELSFERGRPAVPSAPSWAEFLSASASGKMESDFALLTLSDHEQRELYEAARVIQTAFRKYKVRGPGGPRVCVTAVRVGGRLGSRPVAGQVR